MNRNVKLLYCLLGSAVLALLNSPILGYSKLGMFPGGYGDHIFGHWIVVTADILALVGFLLLIFFSLVLIMNNINLKKN